MSSNSPRKSPIRPIPMRLFNSCLEALKNEHPENLYGLMLQPGFKISSLNIFEYSESYSTIPNISFIASNINEVTDDNIVDVIEYTSTKYIKEVFIIIVLYLIHNRDKDLTILLANLMFYNFWSIDLIEIVLLIGDGSDFNIKIAYGQIYHNIYLKYRAKAELAKNIYIIGVNNNDEYEIPNYKNMKKREDKLLYIKTIILHYYNSNQIIIDINKIK